MKFCDLHNHSTASDGTLSPREVARLAAQKGLAAVALTDHNTVLGLPDFLDEAEKVGVAAVPGIEISANFEGVELHILGLFLPSSSYGEVGQRMSVLALRKEESNQRLAKGLREAGYPITLSELKAKYGENINRSHFSRLLKEKGLASSEEDLFHGILSEERGLYVPPLREDAVETVAFLRRVGAVPVWAHPFLPKTRDAVRRFLPLACEAGLLGMEVLHSDHSAEDSAAALALCEEFGLLPSGGSDFHGSAKTGIDMGQGRGDLAVPAVWYEALRARAGL